MKRRSYNSTLINVPAIKQINLKISAMFFTVQKCVHWHFWIVLYSILAIIYNHYIVSYAVPSFPQQPRCYWTTVTTNLPMFLQLYIYIFASLIKPTLSLISTISRLLYSLLLLYLTKCLEQSLTPYRPLSPSSLQIACTCGIWPQLISTAIHSLHLQLSLKY